MDPDHEVIRRVRRLGDITVSEASTARAAERARCAVMAYDYSVLAGTQGVFNHMKSDRLLDLAGRLKLPVVLFAEGGGGRPGDVDWPIVAGLDCTTFSRWAALAGVVPRVGIVAGRCFAGNAALLGCSDVIIATPSTFRSSIRRRHVVMRLVRWPMPVRSRSYRCAAAWVSKLRISSGKNGLVMSETMRPIRRLRPDTRVRAWLFG